MSDETTNEFMTLARNRFKVAVDTSAENRVNQLDDVKFAAGSPDNGWQWPEQVRNARLNDPNGARPVLTNNMLPQHIRQVTNEQRQNRPAGKILPVDDEGDPEVAEVLQGIVRHIEVSSHADVAYDGACEAQVTMGEGYWRLLTDYCDENSFDQDILIDAIRNPFAVYMDPDGLRRDSTGRKCEWAFITDRLTVEEYKKQYPDKKTQSDWDNLGLGDDTNYWYDEKGVMIAEYFYFVDKKQTLCMLEDGSIADKEALPPGAVIVKERETVKREVKWAKINGCEVLEEQDWVGKYIPVIRVAGNEWDVEGKIIVSGIVRNAKDPQRMINYWTSQEAEMLALAPKAPFIGAVGQFETFSDEWKNANTVNYSRLEYDPIEVNGIAVGPPQRQQPVLPPMGIVNAKLGSADDLKAVTGQYDPSLGNNPQSKSGIALQREQRKSEVGTFHYIDNLSRSIGYSTEQIIDMIPKIYDTRRVARIIGEDGEPDSAVLVPGAGQAVGEEQDEMGAIHKIYDPTVGRYDVVVTVGPSYTTKRIEAVDGMVQLTQANPELWNVIGDLIVRNMDWPGADEMAKRIKKSLPPQLTADEDADDNDVEVKMQKVQAAVAQVGQREAELNAYAEQLQQASDQAKQESEQAASDQQKAQDVMNKVNAQIAKLNEIQSDIENAQQLFDMRQKLAEKEAEVDSMSLDSEREIARAEVRAMKAEIENQLLKADAAASGETMAKNDQTAAATMQALSELAKMIAAPRTTELVMDEQGNPIGSRSTLKLEEAQEKVSDIVKMATAPRVSEYETDEMGNPVAATSAME